MPRQEYNKALGGQGITGIVTVNGARVQLADGGWGLVRASNTSAALTARFEASTEEALELVKQEFRAQIALVEPGLDLDF